MLEYRTRVVDRLGVTAEWRGLDWTDQAVCADHVVSTSRLCGRCPVVAECLAAAVTTDDQAEWRGSLSRADREHLWAALERTYFEVRDLELMRMGVSRLPRHGAVHRLDDRLPKEQLMIIADRTDIDLYTDTVSALTRAALQSNAGGSPCDFSDFLARALAATAANVGGPDRLIAGRPGSWESSCVDGLIRGTAGNDRDDWAWFRTEPIMVRLNVAELIEDSQHHPGLMGLDEALESLSGQYESAASEQDLDAWDRDIDMVTDRYTTEYQLYAKRFTLAAQANADQVPGLSADVFVEADTDPNSTWWSTTATYNPSERGRDQLALDIWHAAHDVTPLPNVDVWRGGGR